MRKFHLGATNVLKKASMQCYNKKDKYKEDLSKISTYALESESERLAECVLLKLTGSCIDFTKALLKILRGEEKDE